MPTCATLLADLRTLPDDQRAALLLAELGDLSHAEVAEVIGVRASKVKALVFQARQNLMATADARAIPCHAIREELAVATGAALRRKHLRNHLAQCAGVRASTPRASARQRATLAAILPVVPTVALRDSVLGALGAAAPRRRRRRRRRGRRARHPRAKSTAAKVLAIAAIGGAAAGGGTVAVSAIESSPPRARRPSAHVGEGAHRARARRRRRRRRAAPARRPRLRSCRPARASRGGARPAAGRRRARESEGASGTVGVGSRE